MKESRKESKQRSIERKRQQRAKMVQQDLNYSILAAEQKTEQRESAYNYNMTI